MITRIRKMIDDREAGFTLIELLVVIIIIGILAAIAIPVFLNQRKKGYNASIKSDLRTAANELESHFTDNQTYATATGGAAGNIKFKKSSGNTINMKVTATGYCMNGINAGSDATAPAVAFWWDSQAGGLKGGSAGPNPGTAACAGAAPGTSIGQ